MDIYIPYYDRGWHIQPAKADKARKIGNYWSYCGWIYGPNAYTTEDGAQAYIDKQYGAARISEYKAVTAIIEGWQTWRRAKGFIQEAAV